MNSPTTASNTPYGTLPTTSSPTARKPVSLPRLMEMRSRGENITHAYRLRCHFCRCGRCGGCRLHPGR